MEDDNVSQIEHWNHSMTRTDPYHIMSEMGLFRLDFKPLTILYGRNGSPQKYEISKIATALTSDDIFHWMSDLRFEIEERQKTSKITLWLFGFIRLQ